MGTGARDFPRLEHNRAFSYGDGLFESIAVGNGRPLWLHRHLLRFYSGAEKIGLEMPVDLEVMKNKLQQTAHDHGHLMNGGAVWRLYAFRVSEGRYRPVEDHACLLLHSEPAPMPYPTHDSLPLRIGVAEQQKVPVTMPDVKRMSALDYVLAAREARNKGWDDALMLNVYGRVAECSSSNIFLVKERRILTPTLSEGCLPGVIRGLILEELSTRAGLIPVEQPISLDDCYAADSVLLSNARLGIREVGTLGLHEFKRSYWGQHMHNQLQIKANLLMYGSAPQMP